jgi:hypothetical protein
MMKRRISQTQADPFFRETNPNGGEVPNSPSSTQWRGFPQAPATNPSEKGA